MGKWTKIALFIGISALAAVLMLGAFMAFMIWSIMDGLTVLIPTLTLFFVIILSFKLKEMNDDEHDRIMLNVDYLTDGVTMEKRGDWFDLKAAETVILKTGEYRLIPLGVRIALPEGMEAHIVPRSSTFKRYGVLLTNGVGIIDNDYRKEWYFPAFATRITVINKGDRICQFRLVENMPKVIPVVADVEDSDRGGLGSTGL